MMHEDTILYTLYFVFAGSGIALAGWPFLRKRGCGPVWKLLYGLLLVAHGFVILILLLSEGHSTGGPHAGLGTALAWIYGLIGHVLLAGTAAVARFADRVLHFKKTGK